MSLDPDNLALRRNRAFELVRQNRLADAESELVKLSAIYPGDPIVWLELGRVSLAMGHCTDATESLRRATNLLPTSADAFYLLGVSLGRSGNLADARGSLEQALRLDPAHVEACIAAGVTAQLSGDTAAALAFYERARQRVPAHVELNVRLGSVYTGIDINRARLFFRKALEHQPDHAEAICGLAYLHTYAGDPSGAFQVLGPLLDKRPINLKVAVAFANICRPLQRCREAILLLEEALIGIQDAQNQSLAHFALGKLHDQQGDYATAFDHFTTGNRLANRQYNPWADAQWFKAIISNMGPDFFARTPRANTCSGQRRPVFIIGMPRSGTTLVEQILASHPLVYGAGELAELGSIAASLPGDLERVTKDDLNRLAKRYLEYLDANSPSGVAIVIDKMPDNFRLLGVIELLFPTARIIHCKRDPLDTCLSCYFQYFEGGHFYSYDLRHLGMYYRMYERLMNHWHSTLSIPIMEVKYEELVENPEQVSRDMVDFCGLEWSPKCLSYFTEKRNVVTASFDQVRQPVYKASLGRWRHYSEWIDALREGLVQDII